MIRFKFNIQNINLFSDHNNVKGMKTDGENYPFFLDYFLKAHL